MDKRYFCTVIQIQYVCIPDLVKAANGTGLSERKRLDSDWTTIWPQ